MIAVQSTTATMQVHDDLAALLAKHLTLNSVPISMPASDAGPIQTQVAAAPAEQPKIVYSISQHYHHSAHAVRTSGAAEQQQQQQPQEPMVQHEQQQTPEQLLVQNGIDPTALTPVQLALFKMSAPDRRDYLLQLWRICPPTRTAADYNPVAAAAAWGTMEVEMEKEVASSEMRVQQSRQAAGQQEAMSLDGTTVTVAPPQQVLPSATQSSDGRWLQASSQGYMEPYMASGYEELARREYMASASPAASSGDASKPRYSQAIDPVYDNRLASSSRASWPQPHQSTMEMENQYGALMAMRDGGEMEL